MNNESLTKLRLDRRLLRRKDWLSPAELEQAVSQLPDAAGKSTTLGAAADERSGEGDETSSQGA